MHFCIDELRMLENFVRSIAHIGALLPQIVAVLFWPWVKQYFTPAKSAENHYNTRKDWGAKGAYHDSHFN